MSKKKAEAELDKLEHGLGGVMKEFKSFILKGNIIDMAIGVIIGGAFSKIVSSLVGDVLMPILGAVTGGADFTSFKFVLSPQILESGVVVKEEAAILYGNFLQNVFDFLIIGVCMFFMIKAVAMVTSKLKHEEEQAAPAPTGPTSEELLSEIRDLLKSQQGGVTASPVADAVLETAAAPDAEGGKEKK